MDAAKTTQEAYDAKDAHKDNQTPAKHLGVASSSSAASANKENETARP